MVLIDRVSGFPVDLCCTWLTLYGKAHAGPLLRVIVIVIVWHFVSSVNARLKAALIRQSGQEVAAKSCQVNQWHGGTSLITE